MSQEIDVQAELTNRLKAYWDSTLKSKYSEVASIDISGVKFSLLSIQYDDLMNLPIKPKSLVTKEFRNDSATTIHSTFQQSEQSADSFKWSFTEGLKFTASAKFEASVPLISKAEATLSAELSLGAGQEKTVTATRTWMESEVFDIPPKTSVKASIVLNEAHADTSFTATVLAGGKVVYNLTTAGTAVGATLEGGTVSWTRRDLSGLPVLPNLESRKFFAKGKFSGTAGVATFVKTEEIKSLS